MSGDARLALVWLRQRLQNDPDADEPLAVLEREVERLMGIIQGDPEIIGIHYEPGTPLEVKFRHPTAQVIVMALRDMLDGAGAPNYVEAQLHDTAKEPSETYVVTLQRKHGKTPHQLRAEAEAERDSIRQTTGVALDAIAKACGCERWDYPGQVVRDVEAVVSAREEWKAKAEEYRAQAAAQSERAQEAIDRADAVLPSAEDEPCGQP